MPDPNATYKQAFANLTTKLGRIPTCKDKEWVAIGEELRKAWMSTPATETLEKSTMASDPKTLEKCFRYGCTNTPIGLSNGDPVCYWHESKDEYLERTSAVGIDARESVPGALTNPGTGAKGDPDRTTAQGASGPPRIDERATVARKPRVYAGRAGRGPNGGVMAVCVTCGEEWERAVSRGRPAYRCPGCRG